MIEAQEDMRSYLKKRTFPQARCGSWGRVLICIKDNTDIAENVVLRILNHDHVVPIEFEAIIKTRNEDAANVFIRKPIRYQPKV